MAIYPLPAEIIAALGGGNGTRTRRCFLSDEDKLAERTLSDILDRLQPVGIGVWNNAPLQQAISIEKEPLLPKPSTDETLDVQDREDMRTYRARLRRDQQQQHAYAGVLSLNPDYRRDIEILKKAWADLSKHKPTIPSGLLCRKPRC